jgi:hypothetical protein
VSEVQIIRECFTCDPDTGQVRWAKRPRDHFASDGFWQRSLRDKAGQPVPVFRAGPTGYLRISVWVRGAMFKFFVHRIVWALAHGEYPGCDIDHINGDPSDNRLANLRKATRAENARNGLRRMDGLKGAYRTGKRWFSTVWRDGRAVYLGTFDTELQAHEAWVKANQPVAGQFFNPGYESVFA